MNDQAPPQPPRHIKAARAFVEGRTEDAITLCLKLLETLPDDGETRMLLGEAQLQLGNYEEGFANFEARWQTKEFDQYRRTFSQPLWQGEPLAGKTLVIGPEQALGEAVQFSRYAAVLALENPGARIVLEAHSRAARILRESYADIANLLVLPTLDRYGSNLPPFDFYLPLLSLPYRCRTTLAQVPQQPRRLRSPLGEKRMVRKEELAVGISWRSQSQKTGAIRSVDLLALVRHLQRPGLRLVNLQYGDEREALTQLLTREGVALVNPKGVDQTEDLSEATAKIAGCDLIVTIDNTTAHLAAAMGKPTWVLLSEPAAWRWLRGREDCPWYPSVRLFRQPVPGDWGALLGAVSRALDQQQASFVQAA